MTMPLRARMLSALFVLWSANAVAESFSLASVHFEQNATDGDVEVVFAVTGGDDGLIELIVISPDGRRVIDFEAPDAPTLGLRQFRFESPEPRDVEALKAAYPEGVYEFVGETASGVKYIGRSSLSHRLPPITTFLRPAPEAEHVSIAGLEISWAAVDGVTSYLVEIEQDESAVRILAELRGSSTSFAVPPGFLLRGTEYQLLVGTVSAEGNVSFVETSFSTEE